MCAPSGSLTRTPLRCRVPGEGQLPVTRMVWIEFAGKTIGKGDVTNSVPAVLPAIRPASAGGNVKTHIKPRSASSRSNANGFCSVTKASICSNGDENWSLNISKSSEAVSRPTLPTSDALSRGLYRNGSLFPVGAISAAECSTGILLSDRLDDQRRLNDDTHLATSRLRTILPGIHHPIPSIRRLSS